VTAFGRRFESRRCAKSNPIPNWRLTEGGSHRRDGRAPGSGWVDRHLRTIWRIGDAANHWMLRTARTYSALSFWALFITEPRSKPTNHAERPLTGSAMVTEDA